MKHVQTCQMITVNGKVYEVRGNKRAGADDFAANVFCDLCDTERLKFNAKLVRIGAILVCGSCLDSMRSAISNAILEDCRNGLK